MLIIFKSTFFFAISLNVFSEGLTAFQDKSSLKFYPYSAGLVSGWETSNDRTCCHKHKIDGVAICSQLAPVLANLFMGHHEKNWLQQYDGPAIYFYRRYVDDTFCLFNNEKDSLEFFHYINDKH